MDTVTYKHLEKFLQAKELKYLNEDGYYYVLFENMQLRFYVDQDQFRVDGIWRGITSECEQLFTLINGFNQQYYFPKHVVKEYENDRYTVILQAFLSQEKGLSVAQMESFLQMLIPIFLERAAELDQIFPGAWEA